MHGLPIAEEIIEAVKSSLSDDSKKVKSVNLEMGPLSKIDSEELLLCFEIASKGTMLEDAELDISFKPGVVECLDCKKKEERIRVDHLPTCSSCQSPNIRISGEGIVLRNIEFE